MNITTYIEKEEFYEYNRVFIVSKQDKNFMIGRMLNLETWRFNSTKIKKEELDRRFEIAPIQFSA